MLVDKLQGAALPVAGAAGRPADGRAAPAPVGAALPPGVAIDAPALQSVDKEYEQKLAAKVRDVLGIGGIEGVTLNRAARRLFQRLLALEGVPPPKGSRIEKPTGRPDDEVAVITAQMDARSGGGTLTVAMDARGRERDRGTPAATGRDAVLAQHLAEQQRKFREAVEGSIGRRLAGQIRQAVGANETSRSGAIGLLGVDRDGRADFRIMIGTDSRRDVLDRDGSGMLERLSGAQLLAVDSWVDGTLA
ncbi:hypothetical protein [Arenibaculum pallidiluteum]|uniref:hypothetical protein n=1 Tax=Arenibaculum pallidiluteum TaxID=2812559 RepID=UPI001A977161|nr:hypothetical protein [Arenibaculum pallidiluteum]